MRKANNLDHSNKSDMSLAQTEIDRLYPNAATVVKIDQQKVLIKTPSSAIASEVRLNQLNIIRILDGSLKGTVTTIRVFIR